MTEAILKNITDVLAEQTKTLVGLQRSMEEKEMRTKAPAGVTTAATLHGPGGVFQGPGLERDVVTAMVRPQGISSVLRKIPSVSTDPRFASLTGYTDVEGDEPTNACEDAPAGFVKGCNLTARFGMLRRDTQTIEINDVMLKVNRGDFTDLNLIGELLNMGDNGMAPQDLRNYSKTQILNVLTLSEMVGVGVQTERALNTRYWQGTVALGQMPGLDSQIVTGQIDADTSTACSALDSDVKDFAYNDVCGSGLDIVEYLSMLAWYLQYNATTMGLDPVQWALVMRPNLWFELSACWPCSYLSNRCKDSDGSQILVVNDTTNVTERDRMRASMVLPINGVDYPVVLDTGIFEHNNTNNGNLNAGQFASSIYFVPLTVAQSFPATFIEYVDYRQAGLDTSFLNGKQNFWWTDSGQFLWGYKDNADSAFCYKLQLKTEQRIVLRTPHLAGKLQYVMYSPLQHLREPAPDSPYHQDGGVSIRGTTRGAAVWL